MTPCPGSPVLRPRDRGVIGAVEGTHYDSPPKPQIQSGGEPCSPEFLGLSSPRDPSPGECLSHLQPPQGRGEIHLETERGMDALSLVPWEKSQQGL